MSALSVQGLEVVYGSVVALRGVSIDVPPGAFISVLGANGAGKTTLVRSLTGLLPINRGRVRSGAISLDGKNIVGANSTTLVKAGIAHVPEGRKLFPTLTVEENLLCGAATRKDRGEISANLDRVFELFPRVKERRRQQAGYLSGGEQQMVAVGRALMANPKILLCDELSLGLAPMIVSQLFDLLSEINREQGVSVVVIEQNARLALAHTKHSYVIDVGRVVLEGPSADLRDDPSVQELYLGGGGEAREVFAAAKRRTRGWQR